MSWFRTKAGHLVHAVGEVAAVHRARGLDEVDEDTAAEEVTSGAAQASADEAAAQAAAVDAGGVQVEIHTDTGHEVTAEDEAEADRIIEAEGGLPKSRKPRKTGD